MPGLVPGVALLTRWNGRARCGPGIRRSWMVDVRAIGEHVVRNVEKVIVGKHREVQLTLLALLCRGHILIEDVPGVGKTMLAKAVARSLGCSFKRIQFTPDLLPSDVTGVSVYNQKSGEFEYRPGYGADRPGR